MERMSSKSIRRLMMSAAVPAALLLNAGTASAQWSAQQSQRYPQQRQEQQRQQQADRRNGYTPIIRLRHPESDAGTRRVAGFWQRIWNSGVYRNGSRRDDDNGRNGGYDNEDGRRRNGDYRHGRGNDRGNGRGDDRGDDDGNL